MLTRALRWFLIVAPVLAGVLVLILGTAGSISVTFGIVLIGIGPTVWMWNWFLRMSFDDYDDREQARTAEQEAKRRPPGAHEGPQAPSLGHVSRPAPTHRRRRP